jgi:hypothetical protein
VVDNVSGAVRRAAWLASLVALALLEISHAVANAESDRQVDDGGENCRFHQEDQDRKAHCDEDTPVGGSSVGFMLLKDRRAPFGCDPSAHLRLGYDEQMCTRPDHAFLLLDSPCYVQDVLPTLGLIPPLPEQPAWAFDAE